MLVNKLFRVFFVCWFALSQIMFAMSTAYAQTGTLDIEPPLIEHDLIDSVEADIRQTFFAIVVDDNELDSVSLYYRFEDDPTYSSVLMKRVSYSSTYIVHIPTDKASDRNIEYYIQARDKAGNRTVRGFAFNPLIREISSAEEVPVPVVPVAEVESTESPSTNRRTILIIVLSVITLGLIGVVSDSGSSEPTNNNSCDNGRCTINLTVGQPQ